MKPKNYLRQVPFPKLASLALILTVIQPAAADSFVATGPMNLPRVGHTATLLPSGKVLVAAGAFPDTGSFMIRSPGHGR